MRKGHAYRIAGYKQQTGRNTITPAQRRRARHKLGRTLAALGTTGVRVANPFMR